MHGHCIAGVFENTSDAQAVINAFAQAGISRADIGLYPSAAISLDSDITSAGAIEHSKAPLVQLFRAVLGMDEDDEQFTQLFAQFIDRGCSVVTIQVEDRTQLEATVELMGRFKPLDFGVIEETAARPQSKRWARRGGVHVFTHRLDDSELS